MDPIRAARAHETMHNCTLPFVVARCSRSMHTVQGLELVRDLLLTKRLRSPDGTMRKLTMLTALLLLIVSIDNLIQNWLRAP